MANAKTSIMERTKDVARKMAKAIGGAVLVSGLMLTAPKIANADSVEIMAGHRSTIVDLKVSAPITDKVGVFMRARPSVSYDGTISSFGLVDLNINLVDGLDAVGELQLAGGTPIPRAGMQYFTKTGDLSLYTLATVGLDSKPYFELLTSVGYCPSLTGMLDLLVRMENISDIGSVGHIWSTQRIRAGVSLKGFGFGAAVDLTETGSHPRVDDGTFQWNLGGFVSKTF